MANLSLAEAIDRITDNKTVAQAPSNQTHNKKKTKKSS